MKKFITAAIAVIAGTVLIFSVYKLISIWREYSMGTDYYASISNSAKIPPDNENEKSETTSESNDIPPFYVDFEKLSRENSDIVAWIHSEGTSIDYPVVQSSDNNYYLRRMLNGQYNIAGSIFMDYRCPPDFSGFNSIIYGHNMKNDSMFASLSNYKDPEFYKEHKNMWLFTRNAIYKVEVIAGFVTQSDSEFYSILGSEESLKKYLSSAVENSVFETEADIQNAEKVLVLSTCSYERDNARFVVIGSLVPVN